MNVSENKKLSNVLIVSDFDGTLKGDDGKIPESNKVAIERFKQKGGTFIIASGRAEFVLDVIEPSAAGLCNAPCILSNGSYLFDYSTRTRTHEKCIDPEKMRDMLYLIRDIAPEAGVRIIRGDEYLTPDENEEIKKQIARGYMENVKVYTYETVPVDKINKIAVCVSEDKIFDMRRQIEEKYSDICDLNMSWKTVLEIQAKDVSKGNLLNTIRDEYNQQGKEVIIYAVGDYENDLDMMSKADYACCPSNSLDRVKEYCTIHLCSNNDGAIADLVEKLEKEYNA
ncbi:MAG: HAD-IIB family hydrolase [Clostridia bacterium]|nr:HAD-IIB family hydrolase [Clostridia bacterium]